MLIVYILDVIKMVNYLFVLSKTLNTSVIIRKNQTNPNYSTFYKISDHQKQRKFEILL
jgi:hypothetical protein